MKLERSFASSIEALLRRGLRSATCLCDPAPLPADRPEGLTTVVDAPRLILCLKGHRTQFAAQNGTITEVPLNSREALFIAPRAWLVTRPRQPYESIGVVLRPSGTRFIRVSYTRRKEGAPDLPGRLVDEELNVASSLNKDGRNLCQALAHCPSRSPAGSDLQAGYASALITALLFHIRDLTKPEPCVRSAKAQATWKAALSYLSTQAHQPIGRDDVARHLDIHPNHVSRLFSCFSRKPFNEVLLNLRLQRAAGLLLEPNLQIREVARASGFTDANYFARAFRTVHGMTPSQFRLQSRTPLAF